MSDAALTRDDRLIAGYAALAIAIHVLEAGFPSPVPGIKPGLANVVTLIALLRHSWRVAAWVAGLRVLVGSLLVGTFLGPAFWLSAAGATAALAALGLGALWNRGLRRAALSAPGLSVLAALAHMGGQFFVAYRVFVPHPGLLHLLPLLMAAALLFGLVGGWIAAQILARLPPATGASV
ncbi:MAG: Gx transporter family protein [Gammaproteobacteria bacterium]|nr:Gx transporter family protein [Gammaproteobacteria bacterium]